MAGQAKMIPTKDVKPDDIVIAFMGPTGSGKSNLIDTLTGQAGARSGSRLESVTDQVSATRISRHGRDIVLVDTPGFDDTNKSDMEVLQMIGDWLEKTYRKDIRLSGIVYLHRISDNRMSGSPLKNLRMFGELCGDTAAHLVLLVTTMWDCKTDKNTLVKRERELQDTFWKPMIDEGSSVERFTNTTTSAQNILEKIIQNKQQQIVLLQEELVEVKKRLNETQAGITLYNSFQRLLHEQKETAQLLLEQAKSQNDPKLAKKLESEYQKIESELQKTFSEMKKMKIPFGRRISLFFSKKTSAHAIKVSFM